jgi:hypothetical protein
MPFTFAHPAIVLPLAKLSQRWFSLTGLVAGSMAPDFEYFLRWRAISDHSHSIAGLFYFNLPISLFIAFIFHRFIRDSLIDHIPQGLYTRFYPYKGFQWFRYLRNNFFAVILSILTGALSHIFLDSFTHQDALFVQLLHLQDTSLLSFPIYRIFQHGGTILGFIFICWFIWRLDPCPVKRPSVSIPVYWLKVFLFAIGIFGVIVMLNYSLELDEVVVSLINGGMLGMLFASLTSRKPGEHSIYV